MRRLSRLIYRAIDFIRASRRHSSRWDTLDSLANRRWLKGYLNLGLSQVRPLYFFVLLIFKLCIISVVLCIYVVSIPSPGKDYTLVEVLRSPSHGEKGEPLYWHFNLLMSLFGGSWGSMESWPYPQSLRVSFLPPPPEKMLRNLDPQRNLDPTTHNTIQ